jgi:hypothetical protein
MAPKMYNKIYLRGKLIILRNTVCSYGLLYERSHAEIFLYIIPFLF